MNTTDLNTMIGWMCALMTVSMMGRPVLLAQRYMSADYIPIDGWMFSPTEAEDEILSKGASPDVEVLVMETPVGQMLSLSPDRTRALLLARNLGAHGEYTFYRVWGVPKDAYVQMAPVEFDVGGETTVLAVYPPYIPARFIRVYERRTFE